MPDFTSQPVGDNGVNPLYSGAVFLWNGAVPNKNQVGGGTVTVKGTNLTGTDGKYQLLGTAGAMSFPIVKPATAYTLVAVICEPTASSGFAKLLSITGGNFRLETQTSGGAVYATLIHTGAASTANAMVTAVGGFNTSKWVYVAAYTGTTLRQYLLKGDGTVGATTTETIGYNNAGTNFIDVGDSNGANAQGLYAAVLIPSDIGDAECIALRDNPWRMFDSTPPDTTPPTLTGSVTPSSVASSTATISWPAGADNTAVASYETSLDNFATFADRGNVLTFNITGLTPSTAYTAYVRAKDAAGNVSTPVITGTFTTTAASDSTLPTQTGSITSSAITQTTYTLAWPAGADNVAVTGYEVSLNGGTTYASVGNVLTTNITGRTAGATDAVRVRAFDAAGNRSTPALAASVALLAAVSPRILLTANPADQLRVEGSHALQANIAGTAWILNPTTGALVVMKTFTTDANGLIGTLTDAALALSTAYRVPFELSNGAHGVFKRTSEAT